MGFLCSRLITEIWLPFGSDFCKQTSRLRLTYGCWSQRLTFMNPGGLADFEDFQNISPSGNGWNSR